MHWIYAHLIGDFIIQNDWMAENKKSNTFVCIVHILTYLIPFFLTSLVTWKLLLIGLEHFVQDRTNIVVRFMELKGSKNFAKLPFTPWSIFLVDNILHILFIAWIASI
mgnify:CR=1 FL=1